ncbi:Sulfotransferase [Nannochloropsis gaditana]|uniref:Sulfotransferase n=2 Tax=Nannochloropsis gaditana TaxID=72520 RepID=W7TNR2_9STRA|nr:Sulfotransferase [Nannochloropsis gaditana]
MGLHLTLHDCNLDLLATMVGFLNEQDRKCFAIAHSYHFLVLHTIVHCGTVSTSLSVNTPAVCVPCNASILSDDHGFNGEKAPSAGLEGLSRPRFLFPGERGGETVALLSYPRSGNSMLRTLLEEATGIVTGSDTRPDRVLSRSLLKRGLRGEGVVDERAWIVKSHWPERHGYRRFPAQRIILLVRNPFDAIYSYFNMGLTNTHEERLASDVFESLAPLWEDMARNEARVWAKFNAYWLTQKLPVLVVRYEDLLLHTEEMLVRLVSFLESTPREAIRASRSHMARIAKSAAAIRSPPIIPPISFSELVLDGPRGEDQGAIDSSVTSPVTPAGTHPEVPPPPSSRSPPRSHACPDKGNIGKSLRFFSPALVEDVARLAGGGLRAFGYDPVSQGFPHRVLSLPLYERCVKFVDPSLLSHLPDRNIAPPAAAATAAGSALPAYSMRERRVTLNTGTQRGVRDRADRFGRGITSVRHELTDHDRRPLRTVSAGDSGRVK